MNERFRSNTIYITQGEHAVANAPGAIIATTLGSCVAVCLWDPDMGVGGMNHVLLPGTDGNVSRLTTFGGTAMDRLVNAVVKSGGQKERLRAKVFGGASMIAGLSNIGERNATFVLEYLAREDIVCDARSVGGVAARQVKFWPHDGRVRQRFVKEFSEPQEPLAIGSGNGVELF